MSTHVRSSMYSTNTAIRQESAKSIFQQQKIIQC